MHFYRKVPVKRKIALIFLFFVNIVLLAHAVLPHHHHDTYVCLFDKHNCDDCSTPEENTFCHHEHNNSNKDSGDCLLKNLVVVPAKSLKQVIQSFICTTDYHHFNDILINLNKKRSDFQYSHYHYPPFADGSDYFIYVSRCLGLRAPPVV